MRGVFVDANEALAVIMERLEQPGDPKVRVNLNPDITSDQYPEILDGAEIAERRKVEVKLDLVWRKPPTHFDPKLIAAVENAAKTLGYSSRRITSGAGHDACNLNTIMPAAMVFVPCKDGISHNELEDATQPDCAAGTNVLMHTVLAIAGVAS